MIAIIKYMKIIVWCCSNLRREREVVGGLKVETIIAREWHERKERTGNGTEAGCTMARAIWQVHIARCMLDKSQCCSKIKTTQIEIPTMRLTGSSIHRVYRMNACQLATAKDNKYTPEAIIFMVDYQASLHERPRVRPAKRPTYDE